MQNLLRASQDFISHSKGWVSRCCPWTAIPYRLGTYEKCRFSGPAPDLLYQKLGGAQQSEFSQVLQAILLHNPCPDVDVAHRQEAFTGLFGDQKGNFILKWNLRNYKVHRTVWMKHETRSLHLKSKASYSVPGKAKPMSDSEDRVQAET